MRPVLMTIGTYNVYAYGFFLACSFILSTFIVWRWGREDLKEEEYLDAFFIVSFISLLTARITYMVFHFDEFGFNILRYIVVRETPGLSLIGGSIAGVVALIVISRRMKLSFLRLTDIYAMALGIALTLAKIGQFLSGAGMGRETTSSIGIRIIGKPSRYHPVELYEAGVILLLTVCIFILMKIFGRKKGVQGIVALVFGLGISLTVFILEFFKEHLVYLSNLSLRQVVSLGFCIVMIGLLIRSVYIIQRQTKR
jgi:phosphatidylglycerol---prolipoprotein diacylglyceryl transferase